MQEKKKKKIQVKNLDFSCQMGQSTRYQYKSLMCKLQRSQSNLIVDGSEKQFFDTILNQ